MTTPTFVSNMVASLDHLRETSFYPLLSEVWKPVQGCRKQFSPKHSKASSFKTLLSANDVRSSARKIYVGVAPKPSSSLPKTFSHKLFLAKSSTNLPKRLLKSFSKHSKVKTTAYSSSNDADFYVISHHASYLL
jgi:hypothetical protein